MSQFPPIIDCPLDVYYASLEFGSRAESSPIHNHGNQVKGGIRRTFTPPQAENNSISSHAMAPASASNWERERCPFLSLLSP
jgi:hypothetical protein